MTDKTYRTETAEQVKDDFKALYGRGPLASHGDKEVLAILWAARLVCDQLFELKSAVEAEVECHGDTVVKGLNAIAVQMEQSIDGLRRRGI